MRTPYYEFKEYHTADDNLKFVSKTALKDSLSMLLKIISAIEITKDIKQHSKIKKINNKQSDMYLNLKPKCEPQLGKRKLYRNINKSRLVGKANSQDLIEVAILWVLNYSDGNFSLKDISKISGLPIKLLKHASQLLLKKSLLKKLN